MRLNDQKNQYLIKSNLEYLLDPQILGNFNQ